MATATDKFKALFNRSLKAIQEQAELIEKESDGLLLETAKVKSNISKAVEDWELAKEATALAKDNLTWLKIEIYRKDGHSFNELEELYNRYDHNERDYEVFRLLELEKEAPAVEEVEALADGYQDTLNAYTDQIEALEALIEEHASDSMEDELLELVAKYYAIANTQKEDVNNYLAGFDIKDLIR